MKKWTIIGAIVGMIGPVLTLLMIIIPGLEFSLNIPLYLSIILFPVSVFPLDIGFLSRFQQWLIYIGISLFNIGLFALLGLFLGTIVRGISRFINAA